MTKKQRGLLIAASAAAAVLAVLFFFHPGWLAKNTDRDQMIGTISRADRYRPGGMTAKDVVLTKADVTKLLQDPAFQNLIKNVEFQRLLGDPRFAAMMKEDQAGASRLLGDPRFTGLFQAAADLNAVSNDGEEEAESGFESLVKNADFIGLLKNPDLPRIIESAAAAGMFESAAFYAMMGDKTLAGLLQRPEMKALAGNGSFARYVLNEPKYAPVIRRIETAGAWGAFREALAGGRLDESGPSPVPADLARDSAFLEFFNDLDVAALHKDKTFLSLVESADFARLVRNLNAAGVYSDGGRAFSALINGPGFSGFLKALDSLSDADRADVLRTAGDANFRELLGNEDFPRVYARPEFPEVVKALAAADLRFEGAEAFEGPITRRMIELVCPDCPEVYALAQKTFFLALSRNAAFVRIVENNALKIVMAEIRGLRDLIQSFPSGLVLVYSDPRQKELFKSAGFQTLLADRSFLLLLADPNFRTLLSDIKSLADLIGFWSVQAGSDSVPPPSLLANPAFAALHNDARYRLLLAGVSLPAALGSPAGFFFLADSSAVSQVKSMVQNGGGRGAALLADDRLARIIVADPARTAIVLAHPGFFALAEHASRILADQGAARFDQFVGVLQNPKTMLLLKNAPFCSLMRDPAFAGLLFSGTIQAVLNNPPLTEMLNDSMSGALFQNTIN